MNAWASNNNESVSTISGFPVEPWREGTLANTSMINYIYAPDSEPEPEPEGVAGEASPAPEPEPAPGRYIL